MPPHCDSLDGPVVAAARRALDQADVTLVLPYVPAAGVGEVTDAFALTSKVRVLGAAAREVSDRWFFETVVRVHREGEGASFAGLKPAGLDVGPVIPVAERAIDDSDPGPLVDLLTGIVRDETIDRFTTIEALRASVDQGVDAAREYVSAVLGLQVWANKLAQTAHADPHGANHEHDH
jgi:hypothetical protein